MELAQQHGRKVAIIGRSLDNSTEIAQDLGYLDVPPGLLIHPGQIRDHAPRRSCWCMISGTQGEPMSALSRAAVNNHKFAQIDAGRYGAAEFAGDSGEREVDLSDDRPSGTARCAR